MRVLALTLFTLLSACGPGPAARHYDDWTGTTIYRADAREIHRDGDGILTARPVVIDGARGRAFGVLTHVRRRDANGPRVDQVTSGGQKLAYLRLDRLRTHCLDGCQRAEIGVIGLSETSFRLAARTGLPLRVWGQRGRYAGRVPAGAFAQVLALIDAGR